MTPARQYYHHLLQSEIYKHGLRRFPGLSLRFFANMLTLVNHVVLLTEPNQGKGILLAVSSTANVEQTHKKLEGTSESSHILTPFYIPI
jgi:hypothetical protein